MRPVVVTVFPTIIHAYQSRDYTRKGQAIIHSVGWRPGRRMDSFSVRTWHFERFSDKKEDRKTLERRTSVCPPMDTLVATNGFESATAIQIFACLPR
ncbi:hypothetical protein KIN20_030702 [Parelaphostrongylus tenuis]|uniref:Uncharacterized protein n=1 Tax=Parelaphostrongylus tenuis TaxID=148309 RepID=A0AAD5R5M3_PARTN|nr:hypothetical protein KIN20_030702 [Parelaphostrongylus tenuis]